MGGERWGPPGLHIVEAHARGEKMGLTGESCLISVIATIQAASWAPALGEWGDWAHSLERCFGLEVIVEVVGCPMYCSRR